MNLPNKLTVFRIVLVPLLVLLWLFPYTEFGINFVSFDVMGVELSLYNIFLLIIFALASLTDMLDGQIARKRNLITTFGKFADPIADKLLVNSTLILLAFDHTIPVVPVIIMLGRDIIVDGCRMMASRSGVVVAAGFMGKVKTVTQMFAIILFLINNLPFEIIDVPFADILLWFATLASILSGYSYFMQMKDYIFESK